MRELLDAAQRFRITVLRFENDARPQFGNQSALSRDSELRREFAANTGDDIQRVHTNSQTIKSQQLFFLDFVPHRCEEQNVRVADEQERIRGVRVHSIGDSAVNQRHDGAAYDSHHHQCGSKLRVVA